MQICYWSAGFLSWKVTTETLEMKFHEEESIIFFKIVLLSSHLPIFTDNVPPTVTPIRPPMVKMDTIVDQMRVRPLSEMTVL